MTINNKYISKRREKEAAKDIGGRAHPGSGCFWSIKSDASNEFIQLEDKFTNDVKYTLQLDILKKIEKEAMNVGKLPVLRFGFVNSRQYAKNYCLLDINFCKLDLTTCKTIVVKGKSKVLHAEELYNIFYTLGINSIVQVEFSSSNDIYYMMLWDYFKDNYSTLLQ